MGEWNALELICDPPIEGHERVVVCLNVTGNSSLEVIAAKYFDIPNRKILNDARIASRRDIPFSADLTFEVFEKAFDYKIITSSKEL
jgi:hypothetical protein